MPHVPPTFRPEPGLQGDYHGTCVVCGTPTDTGLCFRGSPEFLILGLMKLGVPDREAKSMIEVMCANRYGCAPGTVPDRDDLEQFVRVCRACTGKVGFVDPVLIMEGSPVPTYDQKQQRW